MSKLSIELMSQKSIALLDIHFFDVKLRRKIRIKFFWGENRYTFIVYDDLLFHI